MGISRRQANEIILNLTSVIKEDINFINPKGIIIASSNQDRVGSFHQGATEVVKTNKMLIIDRDDEYEGTKRGINLPVCFEKNLIAIVGITGNYKEIMQFSTVIVKMSEILIKEQFLNTQKQFKRDNNRVILEMITKDNAREEIIINRMNELGLDEDGFSYFAVCELDHFDSTDIYLCNSIFNSIEKRVDYMDLIARFQNKFVILTQQQTKEGFSSNLNFIKQYIEEKYKVGMTIGLSEKINNIQEMKNAFHQANMVVDIGVNKGSRTIKQFDPSSLEFLFFGFSNSVIKSFSGRVLQKLSKLEQLESKEMLLSYIRNNGSIMKASAELHTHKNTLQYRLNKIWRKTGYNPRELKDLIVLYLAFELLNTKDSL